MHSFLLMLLPNSNHADGTEGKEENKKFADVSQYFFSFLIILQNKVVVLSTMVCFAALGSFLSGSPLRRVVAVDNSQG